MLTKHLKAKRFQNCLKEEICLLPKEDNPKKANTGQTHVKIFPIRTTRPERMKFM